MRVAIDIETTGLDYLTDEVVAVGAVVSYPNGKTQEYLWQEPIQTMWMMPDMLGKLIEDADEVLVHNAAFDFPRLNLHFGIPIPRNIWDTMIGEKLLIAGYDEPATLDAVVKRRLDILLDKTEQTTFEKGIPLTDSQKRYVMNDLLHLFDVSNHQKQDIEDEGLADVWDIEHAVTPIFCKMIARGVRVNREGLEALINEERQTVQELTDSVVRVLTPKVMKSRIRKFYEEKRKLDEYLNRVQLIEDASREEAEAWEYDEKETKKHIRESLKTWRQYNKRPPKPKLDESDINLGSPAQLMAAFHEMGWDIPTTGTNDMKTYLPQLDGDDKEILRTLINYRKHSKMVTAFGDPVLRFLDENNILHGQFQQYGTQTGRPTCKEPNLLQMPSTELFRNNFIAREGYKFIVADYSQMELRLMADLSDDEAMVDAFINDFDLHRYTASLMYNVEYKGVTDKQRSIAKTINFMVLYGGGYRKLRSVLASDGVYISESEAKQSMDQWHATYKRASTTIKLWGRGATKYGYTETAMGRKRRFKVAGGTTEWELRGIERQGANHVIQGSNADITKLAMVILDDLFYRHNMDAHIVLQIYDEIVVECKEDIAETAQKFVVAAMTAAAEEVLQTVPAKVEAKISDCWVK